MPDARQLSDEVIEALRLRALRGRELGFTEADIADLLGVPREDRDQFKAWSTALVTTDISAPDPMRSNLDAAAALYEYFRQFLDERRARPRPDLMSALVTG